MYVLNRKQTHLERFSLLHSHRYIVGFTKIFLCYKMLIFCSYSTAYSNNSRRIQTLVFLFHIHILVLSYKHVNMYVFITCVYICMCCSMCFIWILLAFLPSLYRMWWYDMLNMCWNISDVQITWVAFSSFPILFVIF